ncbi:MAG: RecQ family ATP-dependent DNA helicase [Chloroflexota bacterium]|nr:RecQ family ATP-dependent DNA helicase [Chloroflexota bacterium]
MNSKREALRLLRDALGDRTAKFRAGQWDAIDALVNRRERRMVVERTGWGKSMVYFIATRLLRNTGRGPTLIVSPLLALMRNQIDAAEALGIRAYTINSANVDAWPEALQATKSGEVDVLLISPERLANDQFVEEVLVPIGQDVGMLVVDEVHCISDWGHDFRPDYRRMVNVIQRMPPNVPVLGTTATANNRVVKDVKAQLGDVEIQRGPLMRESLALQTLVLSTPASRLAWLAQRIRELPGTGVIYTLTKRDARQVAGWLDSQGIAARAYYSDVKSDLEGETSADYRKRLEAMLLANEVKALVATSALGMGFDKPDLGFVIHYQAPSSVVAYYQQVGRAGRAIDYSVGLMMFGTEDDEIHEFFRRSAFPGEDTVDLVLNALADSDGLSVYDLEEAVNLRRASIEHVVRFLSVENPSPVIKIDTKWQRTAVPYRLDHERVARLTRQREEEWEEIQRYFAEQGCLMEYLASALDDEYAEPCGKCEPCLGKPVVDPSFSHRLGVEATQFLRHAEFVLPCKVQVPKGAFARYDFGQGNLPSHLRAEKGRVLSRWRDAGWGEIVAEGKASGRFSDELVDAAAEMLQERWRPSPQPTWVTCVPSLTHPELVPDFAARLADALGLPFHEAVEKVEANQPQKEQDNRFHQCRNLDGVFEVVGDIPEGPVLLVDDVVDSSWTLTVISTLLLQKGSGPVWPFALASSVAGA